MSIDGRLRSNPFTKRHNLGIINPVVCEYSALVAGHLETMPEKL